MADTTTKTVRVRDIMTTDVITLVATTSLSDAARSLSFHKVTGAPVMEHGRVVGVISNTNLVDPRYRNGAEQGVNVAQVMTPAVYAVGPGDPVMLAVRLMAREGVHRAIVVDDHKKLVGIVSAMDVLRALVDGQRVQDDLPERGGPEHAEAAVAFVDLRSIEFPTEG